jgi:hypothetical protein
VKVKFIPADEYVEKNIPAPVPAKQFIPDWYKDIKANNKEKNLKHCIPFLDAMTDGYIQTSWTDIYVNKDVSGNIEITTSQQQEVVGKRDKTDLKIGEEFYNSEFLWKRYWCPVFPKGYSGLVCHPVNRLDLPFYTISGIVDFDGFVPIKVGNIPFYIKQDFTGLIPAGTPIFQIIPIKREEWVSEKVQYSDKLWNNAIAKREKSENTSYKKLFWNKKRFD